MSGQYPAHLDVRRSHGIILWIGSVGPLGLYWAIASQITREPLWWLVLFGSSAVVLTIGLWYAREWARMTAGLISVSYCMWNIWSAYGLVASTKWMIDALGSALSVAGGMGFMAWYALRPSMRRRFAEAREAIARARAVPG